MNTWPMVNTLCIKWSVIMIVDGIVIITDFLSWHIQFGHHYPLSIKWQMNKSIYFQILSTLPVNVEEFILAIKELVNLIKHCMWLQSGIQERIFDVLVLPGVTKIQLTGWLKQEKFISHSSGSWKSKIRVSADQCLMRACLMICRGPPSCYIFTRYSAHCIRALIPFMKFPPL